MKINVNSIDVFRHEDKVTSFPIALVNLGWPDSIFGIIITYHQNGYSTMSETSSLKKRSVGSGEHDNSSLNSWNGDLPVVPGVYLPRHRSTHRSRLKWSNQLPRLVRKGGEINVEKSCAKKYYISSWFVTMVEARWRWTLFNFFAAYTADWLFFGFVYWIIALTHDDLVEHHLPPNQNASNWTPCVENIYGFTSTFLFSVEVHTTVAYGRRSITLECPQAITTMCLQCVLSSIFQAFMVGILFAKLTRPKSRTQTILFSKHAIVNLVDDKLRLVFRVGDIRKSRILNLNISIFIIRMSNSVEMPDEFEQIELSTDVDGCESSFFLWPLTVFHVIDDKSPLYNISAADLLCSNLEILAVFEGTIETTGQPVQARTSYTVREILWGHRFVPMVTFMFNKDIYDVDFAKLNETEEVDTPLCSASEYEKIILEIELENNNNTQ